jgi:hypothetical protein
MAAMAFTFNSLSGNSKICPFPQMADVLVVVQVEINRDVSGASYTTQRAY